jgi:uncharacterized protein
MKKTILTLATLIFASGVIFSETLPPKPTRYFNDTAGIVSAAKANQFNEQLAQFERDTSNQVVVATYPTMDTDSSVEDFTQRIAESWGVGQRDKNNGIVLFVFMNPKKIYIQVGRGLEGAVPDVVTYDIYSKMKSYFKQKEFENGFTVGINALLAAAKGEYKGTGKTDAERPSQIVQKKSDSMAGIWIAMFVTMLGALIAVIAFIFYRKQQIRKINQETQENLEMARQEHVARLIPTKRHIGTPMRHKPRSQEKSNYIPIPVPIPVSESSHDDDDDDKPSSSSSSSSDSGFSMPSFESGGGSFGGGGAGGDF